MKKIGIFCLLCLLALSACRKDRDDVNITEIPYEPPIVNWTPTTALVNSSLTGFVADEAGNPVTDANVKVGNLTTTTDDYGHFFLTDVPLNAKGTVVLVQKPGYFNGSRRFLAVENENNRIKVEMLTKSFDYNFNAAAGGTVQTTDGASIVFSPNSIKKENGTIYTGEVKVAARWLDPSDIRTFDQMPGNLQGIDRTAQEVALGTYGMIAVELESDAGESLNISEGNTATLSMPVPASLQNNAPAEIPLWSYNEEHGVWVEEEFAATLVNGAYVGEVSHFSFWNCDYPFPLIEFMAKLVSSNGNPLPNYRVVITVANGTGAGAGAGTGYTLPHGVITGLIPANMDLVMEVYGTCNELLYSQNIGPFADDTDLGTITINASTLNQNTVTGELVDCNGVTIANGLVTLEFDNQVIYEYVNGSPFSITFSTCTNSSDVSLRGVDIDAALQSDPVVFSPAGTYDAGQVSVCDVQLQNYITITVDDGNDIVTAIYTPSYAYPDSTNAGGTGTAFSHFSNNPNGSPNIYFNIDGSTTGDFSNNNFLEIFYDPNNEWDLGQGQSFSSFIVTEYGNVGEPIIGTFSGTLNNNFIQPATTVTVSGSFNIIRQ